MTSSLEIRHLSIANKGRPMFSLNELVKGGEVLTVMGPSGSGKSTLLNWITGMLDNNFKATGSLCLNGLDISNTVPYLRGIGLLYQDPLLFEDCSTRCWRLSGLEGGVMVGPVPFSGEWYTSPDITPEQADDLWCFSEDGTVEYINNGATFSACQGFVADENYPIPEDISYTLKPGEGFEGYDVFTFEKDIFMGIEDTGPEYNIVSLEGETLQILTPIKPCDGAPSNGWFTLTFFAAD